ncbi:MAG: hypothetical protein IKN43_00985 [Selenomonadaceae bacterium]|nr:hypothetical protein [Selenomonadaceae bacterium]
MTALRQQAHDIIDAAPEAMLGDIVKHLNILANNSSSADRIAFVKSVAEILPVNIESSEENSVQKKMEAFNRLMELREEIAATNLPSIDEIRREAIEEKYGYMLT